VVGDFQPVVEALDAHKALDVVVLDLRGLSEATDYFIIATGTSDTHVRALAERVIEAMSAIGVRPHHVEGLPAGRWVLLDFVDLVVHLFHPTLRNFYQLERLWADAPAVSTGSSR
jgi:ribosome-associated protein